MLLFQCNRFVDYDVFIIFLMEIIDDKNSRDVNLLFLLILKLKAFNLNL